MMRCRGGKSFKANLLMIIFMDAMKTTDCCPRVLGTVVKAPEVRFHHEVYTQYLWNEF